MCNHTYFIANINVNKLDDTKDGDSIRCMIDLKITCKECKIPLQFSLPLGLNLINGATMLADGKEAHIAAYIGIPRSPHVSGFSVNQSLL